MKTLDIKITKATTSKLETVDINNIPLGKAFTDHMFICDYEDGVWKDARVVPLDTIPTHPAAMALHYGQAIFEGMKATVDADGNPQLFRPADNAKRLNFSARRMGMQALVNIERNWIPKQDGSTLYLRPFMYADEPHIGMRAATHYKFIIIATPAGPFFKERIKLWAEKQYIRAAAGGTGEAKAAGNYAAAIRPTEIAKSNGYNQVLWLDAHEHKYIQEVGTMNIFFKIDGKFITPKLDGSVLDGITRKSVMTLLKDFGFDLTERRITIDEIIEAEKNGTLEEAFGTGTAVNIAMIESIGYDGGTIYVSDDNPIGEKVNYTLDGIKTGKVEDKFGWMLKVTK